MQGEAFNGVSWSLSGFNREVTIVFLSDFKFSLSEHVRFLIMMCSLKCSMKLSTTWLIVDLN